MTGGGATYIGGCDLATSGVAAALSAVTCRIVMIDLKMRIIEHVDIALMICLGILRTAMVSDIFVEDLTKCVAVSLLCGISFLSIRIIYRLIRKINGLGMGDVYLAVAGGCLLGVDDFVMSVWIAAILTAGFVVIRFARKPTRRISRIRAPYGCFHAASMLLIWLFRIVTEESSIF